MDEQFSLEKLQISNRLIETETKVNMLSKDMSDIRGSLQEVKAQMARYSSDIESEKGTRTRQHEDNSTKLMEIKHEIKEVTSVVKMMGEQTNRILLGDGSTTLGLSTRMHEIENTLSKSVSSSDEYRKDIGNKFWALLILTFGAISKLLYDFFLRK